MREQDVALTDNTLAEGTGIDHEALLDSIEPGVIRAERILPGVIPEHRLAVNRPCPVHPDGTRRHDQPAWECCTFTSTGPNWVGALTRARPSAALTTGTIRVGALDDPHTVLAPEPAPWAPPAVCCPPGATITRITDKTPLPVGTRVVAIRPSWDEDTVPVGSTGTVTQPPPLLAVAFDHDPVGDGGPDGAWAMFGHQLAVLHEPA